MKKQVKLPAAARLSAAKQRLADNKARAYELNVYVLGVMGGGQVVDDISCQTTFVRVEPVRAESRCLLDDWRDHNGHIYVPVNWLAEFQEEAQ